MSYHVQPLARLKYIEGLVQIHGWIKADDSQTTVSLTLHWLSFNLTPWQPQYLYKIVRHRRKQAVKKEIKKLKILKLDDVMIFNDIYAFRAVSSCVSHFVC